MNMPGILYQTLLRDRGWLLREKGVLDIGCSILVYSVFVEGFWQAPHQASSRAGRSIFVLEEGYVP
jgi:hypothetical protein